MDHVTRTGKLNTGEHFAICGAYKIVYLWWKTTCIGHNIINWSLQVSLHFAENSPTVRRINCIWSGLIQSWGLYGVRRYPHHHQAASAVFQQMPRKYGRRYKKNSDVGNNGKQKMVRICQIYIINITCPSLFWVAIYIYSYGMNTGIPSDHTEVSKSSSR